MTAEACIAHQLECLVHPGEFVRVEQLRPGASYLMLVTGVEYFDCVADVAAQIEAKGLSVVHLVSIGGWNSPHPSTAFTGAEWWAFWHDWNTEVVARPERGWPGFAGFDWDIEGNDDLESPSNHFTVATLRLMGEMSVLAKAAGQIVAMAPAQAVPLEQPMAKAP